MIYNPTQHLQSSISQHGLYYITNYCITYIQSSSAQQGGIPTVIKCTTGRNTYSHQVHNREGWYGITHSSSSAQQGGMVWYYLQFIKCTIGMVCIIALPIVHQVHNRDYTVHQIYSIQYLQIRLIIISFYVLKQFIFEYFGGVLYSSGSKFITLKLFLLLYVSPCSYIDIIIDCFVVLGNILS